MLSKRLAVAIPLIIVLVLIFVCPGVIGKTLFSLLAVGMITAAMHEGWQLTGHPSCDAMERLLIVSGVLLMLAPWSGCCTGALHAVILTLSIFGGFIILFRKGTDKNNLTDLAYFVFVLFYIGWCLAFLPQIFFMANGALLLGYLVTVTKLSDIGAFFIGVSTAKLPGGNHKLALSISPKKSWEGLFGGLLFSLGGSLAFWAFARGTGAISLATAILFGCISPFAGLIGDLSESVLKRVSGAKDSGKIPGLGGMLDMLDSLIPMGALFYAWLAISSFC